MERVANEPHLASTLARHVHGKHTFERCYLSAGPQRGTRICDVTLLTEKERLWARSFRVGEFWKGRRNRSSLGVVQRASTRLFNSFGRVRLFLLFLLFLAFLLISLISRAILLGWFRVKRYRGLAFLLFWRKRAYWPPFCGGINGLKRVSEVHLRRHWSCGRDGGCRGRTLTQRSFGCGSLA